MLKKASSIIFVIMFCLIVTGCSSDLPSIKTLDDLNNKNVGVYTGSEYDSIIKSKISSVNIAYYNSYSDEISALKSGKIDGFLSDEPLAKEMLKNNSDLRILSEKLTEDSYAFAINPKLTELKNNIDNIIIQMKTDGMMTDFENKWFGDDESKKVLSVYDNKSANKTIKFATVSGSAPFAYMKDNNIVGYDIDIINYIGYKLGYNIEVVEMSFEGIIPALKSGKVDVSGCSIIVTEERKKSVLFSEPDYTGGIVVVVREK
jgi:polar amino acid transport system substrate-binding protein